MCIPQEKYPNKTQLQNTSSNYTLFYRIFQVSIYLFYLVLVFILIILVLYILDYWIITNIFRFLLDY